jgi:glycosyltransferase involved in cell wall biosynthesis
MPVLTVAFCTFKRADRLGKLVAALRAQSCSVPFEILAVNNNSPDDTLDVLTNLQRQSGAPLRVVTETTPGIVPARNRALAEAIDSDILVFIDDDELPQPGFLDAAHDAIANEGAQCAGGRIEVDFSPYGRPPWLDDGVTGFLGRLDHGPSPLWVVDDATPIWSGNTAYAMQLFRNHPVLRFDPRYNRAGEGIGGGEDAMMLRALLALDTKIRYRPDMAVWHSVDTWKLSRRYFLKLHYLAGVRKGIHELPDYPRILLGIPPFLLAQAVLHSLKVFTMIVLRRPGALRQGMNATHAWGLIAGYRRRVEVNQ